jgi:PAS domain S-box-containing protein
VGLIPLRSGDEIIGLLQLNDRRHNQFTPEMIRFFEGLGASIGIALSRKQADEALRESEEKFRTIFENSSSAMAIISRDTTISMVNREYCKIGLFEEKDVIGKSWTAQIPPGDLERLKEYNRQRLIDPKSAPDHYEFTFYRKDGNIRHSLMSVAIIPTSQNIVCSFVDITDRKQAEADKEKLEVQNRQIQKAESLGRMAGAIAHTFNNQLGVVIGNLELALIELSQGARPHANITAAMSASNKAAEVSGLMLTYLGQSFDKREPLALSDACRWSLPMLRAVMPEDVVLETDLPSPGPAISTNANYIHQILSNLMTNAWESVGEEGGSIHLGVKTVSPADIPAVHRFPLDWQPQDNAYACLEVTDAGSGIADKDIEKIFDPFFSKKFTGRGMGLSVILGIVRTHGGVVTVESEPGRGSIFRVFFPVSAEEVDTAAQVPERRKLDRRRGYRT